MSKALEICLTLLLMACPLKLGCAVCLSSAKLLRIIFPTSIVRISANFYFYIQNEKLDNKKIIKKIKVLWYLNVTTTLANHWRSSKFYL
jgi:hypothetical protein